MKKRITIGVLLFLFIVFVYFLNTYFVIEEILFFYILPYILFFIPLAVYAVIRRFMKKKDTVASLAFKLTILSSLIHILFLILVILVAHPRYISHSDAVADLDFMVKTCEDVHPNLYANVSKDKFYKDVEELKHSISEKISTRDFFKILCRLTAEFHDAHTSPLIENILSTGLIFEKVFFPYKIKINNDRILVTGNYSYRDNIPIGSEIVMINGISSKKFLENVSAFIGYENSALRDQFLSFPIFINMWNNNQIYKIEYRDNSNALHNITTSGNWHAKILFSKESFKVVNGINFEFSILPSNIGYIGFYQFEKIDELKSFLKTTFQQIKDKGINDLIIDIRKNGGGNSGLGDELMQYISAQPFRQFEKSINKVSREVQINNHQEWMKDYTPGSVIVSSDDTLISLRENPLRFNGNCFLLVSGYTFSSASSFTSAFRCYTPGKIIGSETGGVTVSFGDVYYFNLPASNIRMGVSYKKYYQACGIDNNRGIIPDYVVENSFDDERNNTDRVLKYTIDLIRHKRIKKTK